VRRLPVSPMGKDQNHFAIYVYEKVLSRQFGPKLFGRYSLDEWNTVYEANRLNPKFPDF
jgi:hypothetical protein